MNDRSVVSVKQLFISTTKRRTTVGNLPFLAWTKLLPGTAAYGKVRPQKDLYKHKKADLKAAWMGVILSVRLISHHGDSQIFTRAVANVVDLK